MFHCHGLDAENLMVARLTVPFSGIDPLLFARIEHYSPQWDD